MSGITLNTESMSTENVYITSKKCFLNKPVLLPVLHAESTRSPKVLARYSLVILLNIFHLDTLNEVSWSFKINGNLGHNDIAAYDFTAT